jgi:predicted SprT family Zn-dependent metalloprotease
MELMAAHRLATDLMAQHGLGGWTFRFDNARARFGACRYQSRQISLSRHLTRLCSEAEVRNTLLHEIAHALVGRVHGHDEVWRRTALAIGSDGKRTDDGPVGAEGRWTGRCPAGHLVRRHRRPSRVMSCSTCSPGRFDHHTIFEWTYGGQSAPMLPAYLAELAQIQRQHGLAVTAETRAFVAVERLSPGTVVTLVGAGPYSGVRGVVLKRNRSRYVVRTGDVHLSVPFALARRVPG